jgi:hypothetical protein
LLSQKWVVLHVAHTPQEVPVVDFRGMDHTLPLVPTPIFSGDPARLSSRQFEPCHCYLFLAQTSAGY